MKGFRLSKKLLSSLLVSALAISNLSNLQFVSNVFADDEVTEVTPQTEGTDTPNDGVTSGVPQGTTPEDPTPTDAGGEKTLEGNKDETVPGEKENSDETPETPDPEQKTTENNGESKTPDAPIQWTVSFNNVMGKAVVKADGKDVSTPVRVTEGESWSFTVQPVEGYELVKVKIDGKTVSGTLNSDGSYTFRQASIDADKQVQIDLNPIEKEEEATDPDEDQNSDETTTEENTEENQNNKLQFNRSRKLAKGTGLITVSVAGAGNNTTGSLDLSSGIVVLSAATAPKFEGYDFVEARYNNAHVAEILVQEIDGTPNYYVTNEVGSLTAIQVTDTSNILLYYEEHVAKYSVNYYFTLDGVDKEDVSSYAEFVSVNEIRQGEDLNFSVKAKFGYSVDSIRFASGSTNVDLRLSETGMYTIRKDQIADDVTISVSLSATKEYKFNFSGSNTTFNYGGTDYSAGAEANDHKYSFNYQVKNGSITFGLKPNMNNVGNYKTLNKLAITLNAETAEQIAMIPPTKIGTSDTQTFSNGTTVTVKCSAYLNNVRDPDNDNQKISGYTYIVTIWGTNGLLQGDISVATNYKRSDSSEIWPAELVGVNSIYVRQGDKEGTLDPKQFNFFGRSDRHSTKAYFRILDGYSKDAKDITVTVKIDGVDHNYSIHTSDREGYDYYITIPKDDELFKPKDIRISVKTKPLVKTFKVQYLNDSKVFKEDETSYQSGNIVGLTTDLPKKDGHIFQGWTFNGKIYKPGEPFHIDDANADFAVLEGENYVFKFKAEWIEKSKAEDVPFTVNIYLADESGDYGEPITIVQYGPADGKIYIRQELLAEALGDKKPDNWDEYQYEKTEGDAVIKSDQYSVVSLYFGLTGTLHYDGNGATSGQVDDEKHVLNKSFKVAKGGFEKTGYTLTGWTTKPNGQGQHIDLGGNYALTYRNQTLYAEWTSTQYKLTLNFKDDKGATLKDAVVKPDVRYNDPYNLENEVPRTLDLDGHHYIFEKSSKPLSGNFNETQDLEINAIYTLDDKGGTPEQPGDGIPDKYQATVIYKVVNGTWNDGTNKDLEIIYTLKTKNEDGGWAETGITLGETIPVGMKAITEYIQTSGAWQEPAPEAETVPVDGTIYTYSFVRRSTPTTDPTPEEPEDPNVPDNPDPENPTPDNPTPPVAPVTPQTPATPTPPTTTPTPVEPAAPVAVVTPPAANTPTRPVEEPETPQGNIDVEEPNQEVEDEDVPRSGTIKGSWALLNLILAILTVLLSLLMLIFYFIGKHRDDEDDEEEKNTNVNTEEEEEDPDLKRKGFFRLLSIIPAVVAVILFILTEDMRLPMVIIDKWTLWMLVIALINVVLMLFTRKKYEDENNDDDQAYEAA